MKRVIWLMVALVSFVLGTVGTVLPILPTVPLYLLALVGFANSSDRLLRWFTGTGLYKKHLLPYRKASGLTMRAKATLIVWVTVQIVVASYFIGAILIPQIVLGILYIGFLVSMLFVVKTIDREKLRLHQKLCREEYLKKP